MKGSTLVFYFDSESSHATADREAGVFGCTGVQHFSMRGAPPEDVMQR